MISYSVFTNYLHDFYSSDYNGFGFTDFSGWVIEDVIMILIHGILINIQDLISHMVYL